MQLKNSHQIFKIVFRLIRVKLGIKMNILSMREKDRETSADYLMENESHEIWQVLLDDDW